MGKAGCVRLFTEAAEEGCYKTAWENHPKPQMKRDKFYILKEGWTLNGKPICLPYVPQSVLSGYEGDVNAEMVYKTEFEIPEFFDQKRILLHFGAVDQIAEVYLNETLVGKHEGGYLSFCYDITANVTKEGENRLKVKVTDRLDTDYPYGKQKAKSGGMWYTPFSGIWQNVWIENVPDHYVSYLSVTPDEEGVYLTAEMNEGANAGDLDKWRVRVTLHTGEVAELEPEDRKLTTKVIGASTAKSVMGKKSGTASLAISGYLRLKGTELQNGGAYVPKLWSVDEPYLYSMELIVGEDKLDSYFALRTVTIEDFDGIPRVCLNGQPVFWHGVLDQGYYSDGIVLPATEEEYERDILHMKELGFNMLRKHIKIEPECFYYYCDKHGMLVMQDMVNNGEYSFVRDTALPTLGFKNKKDDSIGGSKRETIFREQMIGTVRQLYNHPCIVVYTIFNEGWGQFNADAMYKLMKETDATRLADATSGWFWQEESDFDSEHIYFKTKKLKFGWRPMFISECGGYSLKTEGHVYRPKKSYGYGKAANSAQLTDKIENMYRNMILPGIPSGVCGCIYTQLSDIEEEVNGLYTYDRKVCKADKDRLQKLSKELYSALDGAVLSKKREP